MSEVILCIWFWECQKNLSQTPSFDWQNEEQWWGCPERVLHTLSPDSHLLSSSINTAYQTGWGGRQCEDSGHQVSKAEYRKRSGVRPKRQTFKNAQSPPSIYSLAHTLGCSRCNDSKCRQPLLLWQLLSSLCLPTKRRHAAAPVNLNISFTYFTWVT